MENVPYTQSIELKDLGFNEPCIMQWTYMAELIFCVNLWGKPVFKTNKESYSDSGGECMSAPTFSQAFNFLLEKYNLYAVIIPTVTTHWTFKTMTIANGMIDIPPYKNVDGNDYNSFKEAELACLEKLIEITLLY